MGASWGHPRQEREKQGALMSASGGWGSTLATPLASSFTNLNPILGSSEGCLGLASCPLCLWLSCFFM